MALPTIPAETSPWDQAIYAFLVEKGNRSGSRRTVESYSRILWRFFADTTPDRVTPADVLAYAHGIGRGALRRDGTRERDPRHRSPGAAVVSGSLAHDP
jgi:hypothetical protein